MDVAKKKWEDGKIGSAGVCQLSGDALIQGLRRELVGECDYRGSGV